MKFANALKKEHRNILKIADAMKKECNSIKSGKEINKILFEKIVWFIKNYADKFHHAKEEDILFKEMNSNFAQGRLQCNPIKQMLYEHKMGRDFIKEIEIGLKENNNIRIIKNAEYYIQLIKEHIFKEENVLYSMAENLLDDKAKKSILKKFEKADKLKEKDKKTGLSFMGNIKDEK